MGAQALGVWAFCCICLRWGGYSSTHFRCIKIHRDFENLEAMADAMPARPTRPPPQRRLKDTATVEGIDDLIDLRCTDRSALKSRDFPELAAMGIRPADVQVVLYDYLNILRMIPTSQMSPRSLARSHRRAMGIRTAPSRWWTGRCGSGSCGWSRNRLSGML